MSPQYNSNSTNNRCTCKFNMNNIESIRCRSYNSSSICSKLSLSSSSSSRLKVGRKQNRGNDVGQIRLYRTYSQQNFAWPYPSATLCIAFIGHCTRSYFCRKIHKYVQGPKLSFWRMREIVKHHIFIPDLVTIWLYNEPEQQFINKLAYFYRCRLSRAYKNTIAASTSSARAKKAGYRNFGQWTDIWGAGWSTGEYATYNRTNSGTRTRRWIVLYFIRRWQWGWHKRNRHQAKA